LIKKWKNIGFNVFLTYDPIYDCRERQIIVVRRKLIEQILNTSTAGIIAFIKTKANAVTI